MQARLIWHVYGVMGLVWGLSECVMGIWLCGACGRGLTGSIMTGLAFFHLGVAYAFGARRSLLLLLLALAAALKATDALWLGLPLAHGAVINPVFAFALETGAFMLVTQVGAGNPAAMTLRRFAAWGAFGALLAALAFPLVRFVTGIPACLHPGTGMPLAWTYAPVATLLGGAAGALGAQVGRWARLRCEAPVRQDAMLPVWALRALGLLVVALFALNRMLAS